MSTGKTFLIGLVVLLAAGSATPSDTQNRVVTCVQAELVHEVIARFARDHGLAEQIGHGGWYARKEFRKRVYAAKFRDHGGKHTQARTRDLAKSYSFKNAQYLPELSNRKLETHALQARDGFLLPRGGDTFWKIYHFDHPVGYDQGSLTQWIRVEYSSGFYHGHPMSIERVRKYLPDARP